MELINSMLIAEPENRPTAQEILDNNFFKFQVTGKRCFFSYCYCIVFDAVFKQLTECAESIILATPWTTDYQFMMMSKSNLFFQDNHQKAM